MTQIECVVRSGNQVGEVPVWCDRTNRLWWMDVRRPRLQSYDPETGEHEVYLTGGRALGSYAIREQGGMILAQDDGIYAFNPGEGEREKLFHPEEDLPDNRLNDGRCDRRGRFWLGSMNDKVRQDDGNFWRVNPDLDGQEVLRRHQYPERRLLQSRRPDDVLRRHAEADDVGLRLRHRRRRHLEPSRLCRPDRQPRPARRLDRRCRGLRLELRVRRQARRAVRAGRQRRPRHRNAGDQCHLRGFRRSEPRHPLCHDRLAGALEEQKAAEPDAGGLFRIDIDIKGLPEPRFAG